MIHPWHILLPATHCLASLQSKIQWVLDKMDIGTSGYFVLFGLLFSCGLGVPIPEDIPLLVAGALIGSGHMHFATAAILAWCGIIGGDCVLYYMGHRYGLNITRLPVIGKHVTKPRILKAEALFARYGVWVVAVGRLLAGIRGAMVIAAGTIRYSFVKFVIADGLAALFSGGLFIYLGYKFGQNLEFVAKKIHEGGLLLAILLGVGLIAFVIWKIVGVKKHKAEALAFAHASAVAKGELPPDAVTEAVITAGRPMTPAEIAALEKQRAAASAASAATDTDKVSP